MNDNENLKSLYNTLQKEGYTPPVFEQFAKDMEDDSNLRGVYSTLQNEGYTPPDYDTFRSDMGFGKVAKTNPKVKVGSHAQMVVDEYDRAAKAVGTELTSNNEKSDSEAINEANEPNRTDNPNKTNEPVTPRMQFVPEAENVIMATPTAETLKKYPWLKADEAVPFDRNTGEPLYTWVDEQGNPILQRDLDVRRAKEEITGEKEYMQKTPASLQLPGGTTRGVRLDGSSSGYVDNMMKQQYGDDYLNGQYTTKDGRLVSGAEYLNEKAQETYDQLNKEMDEARMSYIDADEEKRKELVDALANKYDGLLTRDTIQRAMDDEQAQEEAKATRRERERTQLDTAYDTAYARRAEAMNENMRKAQEEYENSSWLDRMFGGNPVQRAYWANQNDRRIQIADTQMNIVLDARKIIDAGEAYDKGETWAGRLVRGMGDALTDTGLYDSGVEDMHDLRNVKNALDAYEAGTATKEQKELLDVYALLHTAQGENADAMGGWYGAGGTTVQALPFMAQMAINPASNLGSATMKAATKWGVKQFGKTAMNKYLKRMFVTSLKAGGRVTGDALAAVLPAFTFGSPAITADTYDRLIGNVHGTEDEAGNIIYKNRSDFETSKGAAIAKAAGANLLEYQSEMAGPYFGALSKIAKTGTLKGLEKIGLEKTRDFLTRFSNKDFYRAYASFARKTQWHGTFEEYLEEVYNNVANAIFIGDMDFSTGDNGVFNLEMNLDTLLGVAVMSGAMSTLKTVDYARTRGRIKDELDEAYKSGLDIFGTDEWERITDRIDGLDDDKAASEIRKIISGVDGKERKHAVVNYAAASFMNQGLNMGELKNSLEQISDAAVNGGVPKDAIPGIENLTPEEQQNVHEDGMIHTALLYPTADNGGEPQEVFITKGNVVMRGDGTIDTEASDKEIYYKGADGQVHLTSPDKFQSVAQPINVEEYAAANAPQEAQAGYTPGQQVSVNIDGQDIQGEVTNVGEDGNVLVSFENPDGALSSRWLAPEELEQSNGRIAEGQEEIHNGQPPITDENAQPAAVDNVQQEPPAGGAGAVVESVESNGANEPNAPQTAEDIKPIDVSEYFGNAEEAMATAKDIIQNGEVIGTLPDGSVQMQKDGFVVTLMPDGNGGMNVTGIERTGNNTPQNIPENGNIGAKNIQQTDGISAENIQQEQQIPQDDEGNLIYDQVPVEATIADLYDGSLNDDEVQGFIDANINEAQKKYDSVQKKAPKIGTNKAKYLEQKRKWQADVDEAKRVLDYWNEVNSQKQALTHTTEEETQAAQAELSGQNAREEFNQYNENGVNDAVSVASDFIRGAKITPENYFKSVTVKKDGLEVSVSSHLDRKKRVEDALRKGKLQYRFDGGAQTEHRPADVSVTTPLAGQGASSKGNATIGDQSVSDMENGTLVSPQLASSESKDTQTSANEQTVGEKIAEEEAKVEQNPTEAQKEAGNYKKGHVKIDGYDVTIENPKGSVRKGTDRNGQEWSVTMNNTYGYIRGTEGVDGDHIDVFLSDDPTQGDVYVIDQVNENGSFDEHKVMYGFNSVEEARDAYLANYSPGWQGLGTITEVSKEEFKKWINSSHRKIKPFAEYKSVNKEEAQNEPNVPRPIEGEIRFREADNEISDFARKHNLNEKDVQDYADYMRRGNLNGAARAFHEIRRKVMIDNEGTSFGEFVKLFSPVKKELYEKFGNIDDLREQYVQAEMEERNMMEAARKRAEEAAEAERRRLQEFQDMSDEQLDEEYSKAVEANDESRMRDLVNEAARRNGYGDVGSEYQGVGAWSAPSNPGYESDEERRAAVENDAPDVNITDIANGYSQQPSDYFTNLRAYGTDTPHGRESAEAINKAIDEVRNGKDPMVKVYRAVPKSVKEGKLRNGDWVTPSRKYAEMHGDNRLEGDYRIIEQEVPASQLWWDGNDINEWGFDDGKGYAYRNTKNNRKLNDLITRDDKGNIIPLSQRFNARKADVRYRFIGEQGAARLDAAEEATTRLDNLSTARQMEQAYNDKKARIDKLRDSKPVEITGEEYKGKYDLNRDSAQDFILKNLRGEYTIADTGEKVTISKVGAKKVTSHSMGNNAHLKSIVAIPQLLENAIFIEETPNEKSNGKYDSYRYYVVGLKIGNEDYTARITIGVKNGEYYYDHYLTEIEKGNLIEIANGFIPTGDAPVPSYTKSKDTRLISLLQTNDQENARKIKLATGWERGADGKWRYETPDFEYHPNGDARQNDKYKESDWYKELYDLEERLFNGETLTDEETKRFDELAARENEIRDNDKNTEHVYLDDYVKDDELFKAYPELKQTRVDFVDIPSAQYAGLYYVNENRITINIAKSIDNKSTLAHEIQHAIQRIEGFANGGTGSYARYVLLLRDNEKYYFLQDFTRNQIHDLYMLRRDAEKLIETGKYKKLAYAIKYAIKEAKNNNYYPYWADEHDKNYDTVSTVYDALLMFNSNELNKALNLDPDELYRKISGEVEARNVQTRLDMSPEERRQLLAEETEDVAREDQIFLQDALGTSESRETEDIDAAVNDIADKLNTGVRVSHSIDEVNDEGVRRAIEKGRNVKGWYDTRTGEIVVYAPNATDADDAVRTVLHEGVAHYGLRQLVGDENFDTFLDNIYNNVDEGIKAAIDEKAQRHGWSTRVATEEYLASLAEDTNFEAARSSGLWQRIKDFFMDLLTKAGVRLNEALTDNELRYILWRSYENLAEPNGRDIIGTVRDVAMQGRLGVGNYGNEDMRLRETEDEQTPEKKSENKYRELYDKRVSRRRARLNRSYFDSMQPVKVLQKTITEETGQQIRPEENVYLQENRANSMAQRKHEMWERGHMEPARREVTKLMQQIMGGNWLTRRFKLPKTRRNAYNAVVRYMKSKHGLENNEYRRNMEAEAAREPFEAEIGAVEKLVKDGNISRAEADKRQAELKEQADKAETESRAKTLNKDYSGLQGIYGKDFERKAKEYVEDFEGAYDTAPLWREWNGATKAILEEEYKSGLLSKELYDRIRNMYKYYIPLKGWAENRAEDVYTYYATGSGDGGKPHRREGRTSESDDPLVTLEQDADRQFTAAARNRTKQALYNLATAHKSSLLTVRRQWYQNMGTKENPDWQRKDPEIPENATPEQMEQIIKDFEKDMRKLEKEGTAMRQKKPMILPYHATKSMEKEHTVRVMVNGKEYVIYVNGNPAAAQAVNGTSTPQDPDGSVLKRIYGALRWINRVKASLLTAVNVNFIPGNLVRDAQYSIQNMKAKEPVDYVLKYVKNLGEGMAKMTSARLFYKDKKGTLNMDDKTERLFKEFLDNGGETGYTARYTLEKQRRRNMAAINRMTGIDWLAGLRMLQHSLEYVNRSVETIVRFAAYKTSREAGRSIAQSINDAKEASVNFDKHGSGELGNKEWRLAYIFSNVGFQALRRLLENASGHPVRFTLAQIERLVLGFAVPMMAKAMLDAYGDDDEKDAYEALPEWMRESGLAVPVSPILRKVGADDAADKVKRVFLYLPLGPEDKIWYALGENTWHLFNKDNITEEEAMDMAVKFGSLAADLLPLDFQGYGGNPIVSLAPTPVQDFVALEQNVNYWGQPIYRESTNYNEHDPGHRLAFTGTPEWYVERAEDINRLTGGDEYTKGWLSPKPEQIEYFINQTGGGVTRVVNQVMSLIERAGEDGNKDIQVLKNVPVVSSLVKKADVQDGKDGFDREKYYDYIDEYEKALHDYNAYRKAKRNGDDEAGQKAEKLKESPTGERMDIIRKDIRKIRNKDKQVRRIDEKENPTAEEEARRDKLKTESNELKQQLVEELDSISNAEKK